MDLQVLLLQAQDRLFAHQKAYGPQSAECLGEDRCPGGTADVHVKDKDEDRIEDDVGERTDDDRQHADGGETLGRDKRIHAQRQLYKDGADGIDVNVFDRIANGPLAGAKQIQQRFAKQQYEDGQCDRDDGQCGEAVSQDLLCMIILLFSHVDAGPRCTAHAQQISEGRDDHDDRETDADPGQGICTDSFNVADVHAVDHII